jgi:hypothetical protein
MNNDSVVKMIKAGLPDDVVVSTINSSPGTYNTSADALVALKMAGASDKVIAAILIKSSGAAPAPAAGQAQPSNQTPAVQEPEVMGKVYFLNPSTHTLEQLPGEQWKRTNRVKWASSESLNVVQGARSSFRISSNDRVVFVFKPFPGVQSSGDLSQMRIYPFDVKSDQRICVVGEFKKGANQGNANIIPLEIVGYGKSSYSLTPPNSHLGPGEYWIPVPGAGSLNDPLTTFGVD